MTGRPEESGRSLIAAVHLRTAKLQGSDYFARECRGLVARSRKAEARSKCSKLKWMRKGKRLSTLNSLFKRAVSLALGDGVGQCRSIKVARRKAPMRSVTIRLILLLQPCLITLCFNVDRA